MKKLIIITASLAVLAGCAAPAPKHYGNQAYQRSGDPSQWQVVSVTPVPLGTGARVAANGDTGATTSYGTSYSSAPIVVQQQPAQQSVYVPQPVYVPEPVYEPRYYYPPVSIGLGFNFGHHHGWGGHVGTRFPYYPRPYRYRR